MYIYMKNRKHFINENYFESVETEKQAYILGFIYADGCVQEYPTTSGLSFSQLEQDVDILEKIKEEMSSTYPFFNQVQKQNGKITTRFYAYSKKLCEDLVKLGATTKKSLIIKFPTFLDENLLRHFIRGYFDGDGCIWNGKRKVMKVKDLNRKEGFRYRIIHNVKFTFTSNTDFIIGLQDYLIKTLGLRKNKIFNRFKCNKSVSTLEYCGRGNIKKLYDFMYKDATIYGERKFKKFNEILCALDAKPSSEN